MFFKWIDCTARMWGGSTTRLADSKCEIIAWHQVAMIWNGSHANKSMREWFQYKLRLRSFYSIINILRLLLRVRCHTICSAPACDWRAIKYCPTHCYYVSGIFKGDIRLQMQQDTGHEAEIKSQRTHFDEMVTSMRRVSICVCVCVSHAWSGIVNESVSDKIER